LREEGKELVLEAGDSRLALILSSTCSGLSLQQLWQQEKKPAVAARDKQAGSDTKFNLFWFVSLYWGGEGASCDSNREAG